MVELLSISASFAVTASYMSGSAGTWSYYELPSTWQGEGIVVTGSYTLPAQPKVERKDKGVQEFFEKLGYYVTWDHNYRRGEEWYELYDEDDHMVAQIDTGFPLADIVEDMIAWHEDREATSKSDWTCSGNPKSKEMKLLFKRVHDFKLYGIMPNGQRTLAL